MSEILQRSKLIQMLKCTRADHAERISRESAIVGVNGVVAKT